MKRHEQILSENLRHQRTWGSGGHATENGGQEEGDMVRMEEMDRGQDRGRTGSKVEEEERDRDE